MIRLLLLFAVVLLIGALDLAGDGRRRRRGCLDDDGVPRGDRWDGSWAQLPRQKSLMPRVNRFVTFAL